MVAPAEKTVICFAHVAYRLQERFAALDTGISSFAVCDPETLEKRVDEADVLVISGLWQHHLLDQTERLRSFSRSAPEPTNSRAKNWRGAASG
jgi:hypothetical protein